MAFKHKVKPGESLNSIARNYGFSDYKTAGVTSVPSGNFDLISPGEEIDIPNYNPTTITPFTSSPGVLSSQDGAGEFKDKSTSLDTRLNTSYRYKLPNGQEVSIGDPLLNRTMLQGAEYVGGGNGTDPLKPQTPAGGAANGASGGNTGVPGATGTGGATGETKPSDNPAYDEMLRSQSAGQLKLDKEAEDKKKQIETLLPKTLALLDAQYASTVANVQNTYSKLIDEQKKINKVNVDRTKAYGINQAGALYNPSEFTDTVSDRETKALNDIANLENERTDLLAKAKMARDQGELTALRTNMKDLDDIETTMRQRTKDLADEVQKRYELTVAARKDAETAHKDKVTKMLSGAAVKYLKDFDKAKDEKEKDALIRKIILDSGGTLTNDDYYSIYSALSSASTTEKDRVAKEEKAAADKKKGEQDLKKGESDLQTDVLDRKFKAQQIEKEKADTAKAWADVALKNEEKKDKAAMQSALNGQKFEDESDAEAKRQAFVKKYGEEGKKAWDNVFKDDSGRYNYQGIAPKKTTEYTDPKTAPVGGIITLPNGKKVKKVSDTEFEDA